MGACASRVLGAERGESNVAGPPPPPPPPPRPGAAPKQLQQQQQQQQHTLPAPVSTHQVMRAPEEEARLRAVQSLGLLGAAPRPAFDAVTTLMKELFGTPVSAVTLIADELEFVSRAGDWACSAGRAGSFCDWTLVDSEPTMLIVEDAASDPRFATNKFVAGPPGLRFYAGAPLIATTDGHRYGTLCVFDFRPRSFSASQYALLTHFAEIVVREMEREQVLLRQKLALERASMACGHLLRAMDAVDEGVVLLDLSSASWRMVYANDAFRSQAALPRLPPPGRGPADGPGEATRFWDLFSMVSRGGDGSYKKALAAAAAGAEFTLTVQPASPAASRVLEACAGAGADADAAPEPAEPVLTIRFRPADDAASLHQHIPHIGIPSWVGGAAGSGASSGASSGSSSGASTSSSGSPTSQLDSLARADAELGGGRPGFYFGTVRKPAALLGATSSSATQLSSRSSSPPLPPAEQGAANAAAPPPSPPLGAFLPMRPEQLSEIKLGPLIGAGGMGRCYRGIWQGGRVAVKIVDCWQVSASPLSEVGEQVTPQAALVEAMLARTLAHPHIITTYQHAVSEEDAGEGRVHQQVWILQEYANRGNLLDAIDRGTFRARDGSGAPNLGALVATMLEIAGALTFLHSAGVVHGDLTPSNVLLTSAAKDGRRFIAKVADFGLSQHIGTGIAARSTGFGTVSHMPPELLTEGLLSKAADVWSFGVLLLECFHSQRAWLGLPLFAVFNRVAAGEVPFPLPPPGAPAALSSLVARCTSVDPSQRPTFSAILAELTQLASELDGQSRQGSPRAPAASGVPVAAVAISPRDGAASPFAASPFAA